MMTLDRKWNQVHFDQETKPTEFKVWFRQLSVIKAK